MEVQISGFTYMVADATWPYQIFFYTEISILKLFFIVWRRNRNEQGRLGDEADH